MKSKYIFALFTIAVIFLAQAGIVMADNLYEQTYPVSNAKTHTDAYFVVQELKYEPYPVNAGDTFDLWVKVQNIGQNDAKNSGFKLNLDYPFSSNNSVQDYGIIFGTENSYKAEQQSGDTSIQANQAVIKFKVRVAKDAPEGESIIKFEAADDKNSGVWFSYNLPIIIKNSQTYTGINSSGQNSGKGYMNWVYASIGFLTGAFIVIIARLAFQKKRQSRHK
jgi:hypothetical protein